MSNLPVSRQVVYVVVVVVVALVKCGIKRLNKKTSFVRLLFVIPFFLFFVRLKRGGGAVCQTTKSKIGKKREKEREVFSLFLQIHSFLFPRNSLSLSLSLSLNKEQMLLL